MAQITGILFDKDGTLFDFHASWAAVLTDTLDVLAHDAAQARAMAHAVGYDVETGTFAAGSPIVAGAVAESAEIWASFRPDIGAARIEDLANRMADEAVEAGCLVPSVPDLAAFLDDLTEQGFVLGVATHDTEAGALQQLGLVGAVDRFAMIAGYDSGHGLKPGPGMALAFATRTGCAPETIAMVGDSVHDLGVCSSAGLGLAIGVLTGPATADVLHPHADHVIDSIAALPALLATHNARA